MPIAGMRFEDWAALALVVFVCAGAGLLVHWIFGRFDRDR